MPVEVWVQVILALNKNFKIFENKKDPVLEFHYFGILAAQKEIDTIFETYDEETILEKYGTLKKKKVMRKVLKI